MTQVRCNDLLELGKKVGALDVSVAGTSSLARRCFDCQRLQVLEKDRVNVVAWSKLIRVQHLVHCVAPFTNALGRLVAASGPVAVVSDVSRPLELHIEAVGFVMSALDAISSCRPLRICTYSASRKPAEVISGCQAGLVKEMKRHPPELVLLYVLQVRRFGVSAVT